jgi:hypothetical protein
MVDNPLFLGHPSLTFAHAWNRAREYTHIADQLR